jgi:hypothetical protein
MCLAMTAVCLEKQVARQSSFFRSCAALNSAGELRYGNEVDGVMIPHSSDDLQLLFTALKEQGQVQWEGGGALFGINTSCGYNYIKVP